MVVLNDVGIFVGRKYSILRLSFVIFPVKDCDLNVFIHPPEIFPELKFKVNTLADIDPDKPEVVVLNDVGTVAGRATARLLFVIVPVSPDDDVNDLTTDVGKE